MQKRSPRLRRGTSEVNEFIRQRAKAGDGAAAILRAIENEPQFGADTVPSERKVEEMVREWRPRQPDDPWTLTDTDPDEAAAVVPVLGSALVHSLGRVRAVSNEEAGWIALIRAIAPDLDEWDVYRLSRDAVEGLVDDVLWYLALRGWEPGSLYGVAIAERWIDVNVLHRYETPGEALGYVERPGPDAGPEGDER